MVFYIWLISFLVIAFVSAVVINLLIRLNRIDDDDGEFYFAMSFIVAVMGPTVIPTFLFVGMVAGIYFGIIWLANRLSNVVVPYMEKYKKTD